jgi:hypothetical protein
MIISNVKIELKRGYRIRAETILLYQRKGICVNRVFLGIASRTVILDFAKYSESEIK